MFGCMLYLGGFRGYVKQLTVIFVVLIYMLQLALAN